MRRHFVLLLLGLDEFLENIPRVSRCVSSALMLSHDLRRDAVLYILLSAESKYVVFDASRLRSISPDESSMSGVLRKVARAVRESRRRPHWGVRVHEGGLREICERARPQLRIYLSRRGRDLRLLNFSSVRSVCFAAPLALRLSDIEAELASLRFEPISVRLLKAEFSFVLVNNELDRAWAGRAQ